MKTVVFDLNGTLTESKESIDDEMAVLLQKLLQVHNVVVVSGSSWKLIHKQVVNKLPEDSNISNLYVLPTSGGSMYQTWGKYGWVATYQLKLQKPDSDRITQVLDDMIKEHDLDSQKLWGKQIDYRECQVTLSVLGQNAPSDIKATYDPDGSKRRAFVEILQKKLPAFDIRVSGRTSIDISLRGVNKKYGIDELMKRLHVSKDDVIFVGNEIFKGGNDYAAVEMGLEHFSVKDPEETKTWIRKMLDSSAALEKTG